MNYNTQKVLMTGGLFQLISYSQDLGDEGQGQQGHLAGEGDHRVVQQATVQSG